MKIRNCTIRVLLGLALTVAFVSTANTEVRAELKTQEVVSNETVFPNTKDSGKWGNLTWKYKDGTLTISGKGKMVSKENYSEYPWSEYDFCTDEIVIGDSVTSIGAHAFEDMEKTKKVTLGSKVKTIGESAFKECKALTKVKLNSGLSSIGDEAFYRSGITSITIPDSCTSLGKRVFYRCYSLKSVKLGEGITTVSEYAFEYCKNLEEVTMSDNVHTIEEAAFIRCEKLESIPTSKKLKKIELDAFANCISLKEVILPKSVEVVGGQAFRGCTSLTYAEVGANVSLIDSSAFSMCSSLEKFVCYSGNAYIAADGDDYKFGEVFVGCPVTIYSWEDSIAKKYAEYFEIPFVAIESLDTPKNVKVSNVTDGVKVSWDEVGGAATYVLYRATSKDGNYVELNSEILDPTYTDTTAKNGKTYYYKVKAISPYGTSKQSSAKKKTFVSAPEVKSCTNLSSGIKVTWNKITGATGYKVYRKTSSDSWKLVYTAKKGTTTSWTDKTIKSKNGTKYFYTVRAVKGSLVSGRDDKGFTTVRLTTRSLKSVTKVSKSSINCKWSTSSSVTGYQIRITHELENERIITIKDKKTSTKKVTELTPGAKYKIQVRSYKTVGSKKYYSAWSSSKTVKMGTSKDNPEGYPEYASFNDWIAKAGRPTAEKLLNGELKWSKELKEPASDGVVRYYSCGLFKFKDTGFIRGVAICQKEDGTCFYEAM